MTDPRPALLLGFDIEDWTQLEARRLGLDDWDRPGPAFERQMLALFDLLDEIGGRCTFFVVGITAKNYPDLLREAVGRGHEIACHSHAHERVHTLTREAFRADLERALEQLATLTPTRPRGYRAPAFSLTRDTAWAFEELADLGFDYDSSLYDLGGGSRIGPAGSAPFHLSLPSDRQILEFPPPTMDLLGRTVPLGGGSYWRVLPTPILGRGVRSVAREAGYVSLYFHPYEFDPRWLRTPRGTLPRPRRWLNDVRYNLGRSRVAVRLRRIARSMRPIPYAEAADELGSSPPTRSLTALAS